MALQSRGTMFFFVLVCLMCMALLKFYLMRHAHDQLLHHHYELSKHILDRGSKITEPHTGQFLEQGSYYQDLIAKNPNIKKVCEIGFNAGHSALTFLDASPDTIVYSFDIWEHQYSNIAQKFIKERYPDRLTIIKGDSKKSANEFIAMHHILCDLIHFDGSNHDGATTADIVNFKSAAHCNTIIILDGAKCDENIGAEWEALVAKQVTVEDEVHVTFRDSCSKTDLLCAERCASWTVGHYFFNHCAKSEK